MTDETPPPPVGDGLSETSTTTPGGSDVLVMYEMAGEASGDAWLAATSDSLVRDPDASRKV